MVSWRILAGVTLLWQGAYGSESPKLSPADCTAAINAVRNIVEFTEFKSVSSDQRELIYDESDAGNKAFWDAVCQGMQPVSKGGPPVKKPAGTYAYYPQHGVAAECLPAVQHWRRGIIAFGPTIPPIYKGKTAPYDTNQAVSFIALFNPQENPTVECVTVECPVATASPEKQASNSGSKNGGLLGSSTKLNALVCLTKPVALKAEERPYTEEEWTKLTSVYRSSTYIAAPAFLTLASVAAFISLL